MDPKKQGNLNETPKSAQPRLPMRSVQKRDDPNQISVQYNDSKGVGSNQQDIITEIDITRKVTRKSSPTLSPETTSVQNEFTQALDQFIQKRIQHVPVTTDGDDEPQTGDDFEPADSFVPPQEENGNLKSIRDKFNEIATRTHRPRQLSFNENSEIDDVDLGEIDHPPYEPILLDELDNEGRFEPLSNITANQTTSEHETAASAAVSILEAVAYNDVNLNNLDELQDNIANAMETLSTSDMAAIDNRAPNAVARLNVANPESEFANSLKMLEQYIQNSDGFEEFENEILEFSQMMDDDDFLKEPMSIPSQQQTQNTFGPAFASNLASMALKMMDSDQEIDATTAIDDHENSILNVLDRNVSIVQQQIEIELSSRTQHSGIPPIQKQQSSINDIVNIEIQDTEEDPALQLHEEPIVEFPESFVDNQHAPINIVIHDNEEEPTLEIYEGTEQQQPIVEFPESFNLEDENEPEYASFEDVDGPVAIDTDQLLDNANELAPWIDDRYVSLNVADTGKTILVPRSVQDLALRLIALQNEAITTCMIATSDTVRSQLVTRKTAFNWGNSIPEYELVDPILNCRNLIVAFGAEHLLGVSRDEAQELDFEPTKRDVAAYFLQDEIDLKLMLQFEREVEQLEAAPVPHDDSDVYQQYEQVAERRALNFDDIPIDPDVVMWPDHPVAMSPKQPAPKTGFYVKQNVLDESIDDGVHYDELAQADDLFAEENIAKPDRVPYVPEQRPPQYYKELATGQERRNVLRTIGIEEPLVPEPILIPEPVPVDPEKQQFADELTRLLLMKPDRFTKDEDETNRLRIEEEELEIYKKEQREAERSRAMAAYERKQLEPKKTEDENVREEEMFKQLAMAALQLDSSDPNAEPLNIESLSPTILGDFENTKIELSQLMDDAVPVETDEAKNIETIENIPLPIDNEGGTNIVNIEDKSPEDQISSEPIQAPLSPSTSAQPQMLTKSKTKLKKPSYRTNIQSAKRIIYTVAANRMFSAEHRQLSSELNLITKQSKSVQKLPPRVDEIKEELGLLEKIMLYTNLPQLTAQIEAIQSSQQKFICNYTGLLINLRDAINRCLSIADKSVLFDEIDGYLKKIGELDKLMPVVRTFLRQIKTFFGVNDKLLKLNAAKIILKFRKEVTQVTAALSDAPIEDDVHVAPKTVALIKDDVKEKSFDANESAIEVLATSIMDTNKLQDFQHDILELAKLMDDIAPLQGTSAMTNFPFLNLSESGQLQLADGKNIAPDKEQSLVDKEVSSVANAKIELLAISIMDSAESPNLQNNILELSQMMDDDVLVRPTPIEIDEINKQLQSDGDAVVDDKVQSSVDKEESSLANSRIEVLARSIMDSVESSDLQKNILELSQMMDDDVHARSTSIETDAIYEQLQLTDGKAVVDEREPSSVEKEESSLANSRIEVLARSIIDSVQTSDLQNNILELSQMMDGDMQARPTPIETFENNEQLKLTDGEAVVDEKEQSSVDKEESLSNSRIEVLARSIMDSVESSDLQKNILELSQMMDGDMLSSPTPIQSADPLVQSPQDFIASTVPRADRNIFDDDVLGLPVIIGDIYGLGGTRDIRAVYGYVPCSIADSRAVVYVHPHNHESSQAFLKSNTSKWLCEGQILASNILAKALEKKVTYLSYGVEAILELPTIEQLLKYHDYIVESGQMEKEIEKASFVYQCGVPEVPRRFSDTPELNRPQASARRYSDPLHMYVEHLKHGERPREMRKFQLDESKLERPLVDHSEPLQVPEYAEPLNQVLNKIETQYNLNSISKPSNGTIPDMSNVALESGKPKSIVKDPIQKPKPSSISTPQLSRAPIISKTQPPKEHEKPKAYSVASNQLFSAEHRQLSAELDFITKKSKAGQILPPKVDEIKSKLGILEKQMLDTNMPDLATQIEAIPKSQKKFLCNYTALMLNLRDAINRCLCIADKSVLFEEIDGYLKKIMQQEKLMPAVRSLLQQIKQYFGLDESSLKLQNPTAAKIITKFRRELIQSTAVNVPQTVGSAISVQNESTISKSKPDTSNVALQPGKSISKILNEAKVSKSKPDTFNVALQPGKSITKVKKPIQKPKQSSISTPQFSKAPIISKTHPPKVHEKPKAYSVASNQLFSAEHRQLSAELDFITKQSKSVQKLAPRVDDIKRELGILEQKMLDTNMPDLATQIEAIPKSQQKFLCNYTALLVNVRDAINRCLCIADKSVLFDEIDGYLKKMLQQEKLMPAVRSLLQQIKQYFGLDESSLKVQNPTAAKIITKFRREFMQSTTVNVPQPGESAIAVQKVATISKSKSDTSNVGLQPAKSISTVTEPIQKPTPSSISTPQLSKAQLSKTQPSKVQEKPKAYSVASNQLFSADHRQLCAELDFIIKQSKSAQKLSPRVEEIKEEVVLLEQIMLYTNLPHLTSQIQAMSGRQQKFISNYTALLLNLRDAINRCLSIDDKSVLFDEIDGYLKKILQQEKLMPAVKSFLQQVKTYFGLDESSLKVKNPNAAKIITKFRREFIQTPQLGEGSILVPLEATIESQNIDMVAPQRLPMNQKSTTKLLPSTQPTPSKEKVTQRKHSQTNKPIEPKLVYTVTANHQLSTDHRALSQQLESLMRPSTSGKRNAQKLEEIQLQLGVLEKTMVDTNMPNLIPEIEAMPISRQKFICNYTGILLNLRDAINRCLWSDNKTILYEEVDGYLKKIQEQDKLMPAIRQFLKQIRQYFGLEDILTKMNNPRAEQIISKFRKEKVQPASVSDPNVVALPSQSVTKLKTLPTKTHVKQITKPSASRSVSTEQLNLNKTKTNSTASEIPSQFTKPIEVKQQVYTVAANDMFSSEHRTLTKNLESLQRPSTSSKQHAKQVDAIKAQLGALEKTMFDNNFPNMTTKIETMAVSRQKFICQFTALLINLRDAINRCLWLDNKSNLFQEIDGYLKKIEEQEKLMPAVRQFLQPIKQYFGLDVILTKIPTAAKIIVKFRKEPKPKPKKDSTPDDKPRDIKDLYMYLFEGASPSNAIQEHLDLCKQILAHPKDENLMKRLGILERVMLKIYFPEFRQSVSKLNMVERRVFREYAVCLLRILENITQARRHSGPEKQQDYDKDCKALGSNIKLMRSLEKREPNLATLFEEIKTYSGLQNMLATTSDPLEIIKQISHGPQYPLMSTNQTNANEEQNAEENMPQTPPKKKRSKSELFPHFFSPRTPPPTYWKSQPDSPLFIDTPPERQMPSKPPPSPEGSDTSFLEFQERFAPKVQEKPDKTIPITALVGHMTKDPDIYENIDDIRLATSSSDETNEFDEPLTKEVYAEFMGKMKKDWYFKELAARVDPFDEHARNEMKRLEKLIGEVEERFPGIGEQQSPQILPAEEVLIESEPEPEMITESKRMALRVMDLRTRVDNQPKPAQPELPTQSSAAFVQQLHENWQEVELVVEQFVNRYRNENLMDEVVTGIRPPYSEDWIYQNNNRRGLQAYVELSDMEAPFSSSDDQKPTADRLMTFSPTKPVSKPDNLRMLQLPDLTGEDNYNVDDIEAPFSIDGDFVLPEPLPDYKRDVLKDELYHHLMTGQARRRLQDNGEDDEILGDAEIDANDLFDESDIHEDDLPNQELSHIAVEVPNAEPFNMESRINKLYNEFLYEPVTLDLSEDDIPVPSLKPINAQNLQRTEEHAIDNRFPSAQRDIYDAYMFEDSPDELAKEHKKLVQEISNPNTQPSDVEAMDDRRRILEQVMFERSFPDFLQTVSNLDYQRKKFIFEYSALLCKLLSALLSNSNIDEIESYTSSMKQMDEMFVDLKPLLNDMKDAIGLGRDSSTPGAPLQNLDGTEQPFIGVDLENKPVDIRTIYGFGGDLDIRAAYGYERLLLSQSDNDHFTYVPPGHPIFNGSQVTHSNLLLMLGAVIAHELDMRLGNWIARRQLDELSGREMQLPGLEQLQQMMPVNGFVTQYISGQPINEIYKAGTVSSHQPTETAASYQNDFVSAIQESVDQTVHLNTIRRRMNKPAQPDAAPSQLLANILAGDFNVPIEIPPSPEQKVQRLRLQVDASPEPPASDETAPMNEEKMEHLMRLMSAYDDNDDNDLGILDPDEMNQSDIFVDAPTPADIPQEILEAENLDDFEIPLVGSDSEEDEASTEGDPDIANMTVIHIVEDSDIENVPVADMNEAPQAPQESPSTIDLPASEFTYSNWLEGEARNLSNRPLLPLDPNEEAITKRELYEYYEALSYDEPAADSVKRHTSMAAEIEQSRDNPQRMAALSERLLILEQVMVDTFLPQCLPMLSKFNEELQQIGRSYGVQLIKLFDAFDRAKANADGPELQQIMLEIGKTVHILHYMRQSMSELLPFERNLRGLFGLEYLLEGTTTPEDILHKFNRLRNGKFQLIQPDAELVDPDPRFIGVDFRNEPVDIRKLYGFGGNVDIREAYGFVKLSIPPAGSGIYTYVPPGLVPHVGQKSKLTDMKVKMGSLIAHQLDLRLNEWIKGKNMQEVEYLHDLPTFRELNNMMPSTGDVTHYISGQPINEIYRAGTLPADPLPERIEEIPQTLRATTERTNEDYATIAQQMSQQSSNVFALKNKLRAKQGLSPLPQPTNIPPEELGNLFAGQFEIANTIEEPVEVDRVGLPDEPPKDLSNEIINDEALSESAYEALMNKLNAPNVVREPIVDIPASPHGSPLSAAEKQQYADWIEAAEELKDTSILDTEEMNMGDFLGDIEVNEEQLFAGNVEEHLDNQDLEDFDLTLVSRESDDMDLFLDIEVDTPLAEAAQTEPTIDNQPNAVIPLEPRSSDELGSFLDNEADAQHLEGEELAPTSAASAATQQPIAHIDMESRLQQLQAELFADSDDTEQIQPIATVDIETRLKQLQAELFSDSDDATQIQQPHPLVAAKAAQPKMAADLISDIDAAHIHDYPVTAYGTTNVPDLPSIPLQPIEPGGEIETSTDVYDMFIALYENQPIEEAVKAHTNLWNEINDKSDTNSTDALKQRLRILEHVVIKLFLRNFMPMISKLGNVEHKQNVIEYAVHMLKLANAIKRGLDQRSSPEGKTILLEITKYMHIVHIMEQSFSELKPFVGVLKSANNLKDVLERTTNPKEILDSFKKTREGRYEMRDEVVHTVDNDSPYIGVDFNNQPVNIRSLRGFGGNLDIREAYGFVKLSVPPAGSGLYTYAPPGHVPGISIRSTPAAIRTQLMMGSIIAEQLELVLYDWLTGQQLVGRQHIANIPSYRELGKRLRTLGNITHYLNGQPINEIYETKPRSKTAKHLEAGIAQSARKLALQNRLRHKQGLPPIEQLAEPSEMVRLAIEKEFHLPERIEQPTEFDQIQEPPLGVAEQIDAAEDVEEAGIMDDLVLLDRTPEPQLLDEAADNRLINMLEVLDDGDLSIITEEQMNKSNIFDQVLPVKVQSDITDILTEDQMDSQNLFQIMLQVDDQSDIDDVLNEDQMDTGALFEDTETPTATWPRDLVTPANVSVFQDGPLRLRQPSHRDSPKPSTSYVRTPQQRLLRKVKPTTSRYDQNLEKDNDISIQYYLSLNASINSLNSDLNGIISSSRKTELEHSLQEHETQMKILIDMIIQKNIPHLVKDINGLREPLFSLAKHFTVTLIRLKVLIFQVEPNMLGHLKVELFNDIDSTLGELRSVVQETPQLAPMFTSVQNALELEDVLMQSVPSELVKQFGKQANLRPELHSLQLTSPVGQSAVTTVSPNIARANEGDHLLNLYTDVENMLFEDDSLDITNEEEELLEMVHVTIQELQAQQKLSGFHLEEMEEDIDYFEEPAEEPIEDSEIEIVPVKSKTIVAKGKAKLRGGPTMRKGGRRRDIMGKLILSSDITGTQNLPNLNQEMTANRIAHIKERSRQMLAQDMKDTEEKKEREKLKLDKKSEEKLGKASSRGNLPKDLKGKSHLPHLNKKLSAKELAHIKDRSKQMLAMALKAAEEKRNAKLFKQSAPEVATVQTEIAQLEPTSPLKTMEMKMEELRKKLAIRRKENGFIDSTEEPAVEPNEDTETEDVPIKARNIVRKGKITTRGGPKMIKGGRSRDIMGKLILSSDITGTENLPNLSQELTAKRIAHIKERARQMLALGLKDAEEKKNKEKLKLDKKSEGKIGKVTSRRDLKQPEDMQDKSSFPHLNKKLSAKRLAYIRKRSKQTLAMALKDAEDKKKAKLLKQQPKTTKPVEILEIPDEIDNQQSIVNDRIRDLMERAKQVKNQQEPENQPRLADLLAPDEYHGFGKGVLASSDKDWLLYNDVFPKRDYFKNVDGNEMVENDQDNEQDQEDLVQIPQEIERKKTVANKKQSSKYMHRKRDIFGKLINPNDKEEIITKKTAVTKQSSKSSLKKTVPMNNLVKPTEEEAMTTKKTAVIKKSSKSSLRKRDIMGKLIKPIDEEEQARNNEQRIQMAKQKIEIIKKREKEKLAAIARGRARIEAKAADKKMATASQPNLTRRNKVVEKPRAVSKLREKAKAKDKFVESDIKATSVQEIESVFYEEPVADEYLTAEKEPLTEFALATQRYNQLKATYKMSEPEKEVETQVEPNQTTKLEEFLNVNKQDRLAKAAQRASGLSTRKPEIPQPTKESILMAQYKATLEAANIKPKKKPLIYYADKNKQKQLPRKPQTTESKSSVRSLMNQKSSTNKLAPDAKTTAEAGIKAKKTFSKTKQPQDPSSTDVLTQVSQAKKKPLIYYADKNKEKPLPRKPKTAESSSSVRSFIKQKKAMNVPSDAQIQGGAKVLISKPKSKLQVSGKRKPESSEPLVPSTEQLFFEARKLEKEKAAALFLKAQKIAKEKAAVFQQFQKEPLNPEQIPESHELDLPQPKPSKIEKLYMMNEDLKKQIKELDKQHEQFMAQPIEVEPYVSSKEYTDKFKRILTTVGRSLPEPEPELEPEMQVEESIPQPTKESILLAQYKATLKAANTKPKKKPLIYYADKNKQKALPRKPNTTESTSSVRTLIKTKSSTNKLSQAQDSNIQTTEELDVVAQYKSTLLAVEDSKPKKKPLVYYADKNKQKPLPRKPKTTESTSSVRSLIKKKSSTNKLPEINTQKSIQPAEESDIAAAEAIKPKKKPLIYYADKNKQKPLPRKPQTEKSTSNIRSLIKMKSTTKVSTTTTDPATTSQHSIKSRASKIKATDQQKVVQKQKPKIRRKSGADAPPLVLSTEQKDLINRFENVKTEDVRPGDRKLYEIYKQFCAQHGIKRRKEVISQPAITDAAEPTQILQSQQRENVELHTEQEHPELAWLMPPKPKSPPVHRLTTPEKLDRENQRLLATIKRLDERHKQFVEQPIEPIEFSDINTIEYSARLSRIMAKTRKPLHQADAANYMDEPEIQEIAAPSTTSMVKQTSSKSKQQKITSSTDALAQPKKKALIYYADKNKQKPLPRKPNTAESTSSVRNLINQKPSSNKLPLDVNIAADKPTKPKPTSSKTKPSQDPSSTDVLPPVSQPKKKPLIYYADKNKQKPLPRKPKTAESTSSVRNLIKQKSSTNKLAPDSKTSADAGIKAQKTSSKIKQTQDPSSTDVLAQVSQAKKKPLIYYADKNKEKPLPRKPKTAESTSSVRSFIKQKRSMNVPSDVQIASRVDDPPQIVSTEQKALLARLAKEQANKDAVSKKSSSTKTASRSSLSSRTSKKWDDPPQIVSTEQKALEARLAKEKANKDAKASKSASHGSLGSRPSESLSSKVARRLEQEEPHKKKKKLIMFADKRKRHIQPACTPAQSNAQQKDATPQVPTFLPIQHTPALTAQQLQSDANVRLIGESNVKLGRYLQSNADSVQRIADLKKRVAQKLRALDYGNA